MRFGLIDRIIELTRGERVVAVKAVSLAEEYLADHFPTFPVLPGVLMLEALTEAAAWLVRDSQDFASNVILLREARNVTYKSFVKPGNLLTLEVDCRRLEKDESEFAGCGFCNQEEVVKARFSLTHFAVSMDAGSLVAGGPDPASGGRAMFERLRS
ncbi:MAG: beta-hydroxyacyl-ACP dehydratase [Phycisphaerales bacterium]|nr:MAG: beta-hydroxyacyl-ACP dehydratase [Phycisphaerales bacterium]